MRNILDTLVTRSSIGYYPNSTQTRIISDIRLNHVFLKISTQPKTDFSYQFESDIGYLWADLVFTLLI